MTPEKQSKKVLITGASGLIGGLVLEGLGHKYEFSALNRRKVEAIPCHQADISDLEAILPAFEGIHTVVHLAAYTQGDEWEPLLAQNIVGRYNVYEAACRCGVQRVILASSGGTMVGYELESPYGELAAGEYDKVPPEWTLINHRMPVRPGGLDYVPDVFGEVLGRYYSDFRGLSVLCIRLGAVLDTNRPKLVRHFPGYLSHRDCVSIVEKCLDAPKSLRYDIFDAISNNRWRWRDIEHAREVLGWEPQDSADDFDLP